MNMIDENIKTLEKLFLVTGNITIIKRTIKNNKIKPNMNCLLHACICGCEKYIIFLCDTYKLVTNKECLIYSFYGKKGRSSLFFTILHYMKLDPNYDDTKRGKLLTFLGYRGEFSSDIQYYLRQRKELLKNGKITSNNQMKEFFEKNTYDSIKELNDEVYKIWKEEIL